MLYEVITRHAIRGSHVAAVRALPPAVHVRDVPGGSGDHGRGSRAGARIAAGDADGTVITSYSIHYTKLYED